MTMLCMALLFLVGLALICKGGDLFVDAAASIAEATGIPKFAVGATVVSVATTLPELFVSLLGTLDGRTGLALGNAVGSVTANLGLILGISALALPGRTARRDFAPKALLMAASGGVLYLAMRSGGLTLPESAALLALLAGFLALNLRGAKQSMDGARAVRRKLSRADLVKFAAGAAAIVGGSRLLVDNGSGLARLFGVPEHIIGLTLVAVGTSLPELVTTVAALLRKEPALSVGNIIGANILDLTLVPAVCTAAAGGLLPVGEQMARLDLPVMLFCMLLAILPPACLGRFYRLQGAAMLLVYLLYTALLTLPML